MNDLEKRAHDIAVRLLPYTLKEFDPNFTYLIHDEIRKVQDFRSRDVVEEYILLYEELLRDLEEYGNF